MANPIQKSDLISDEALKALEEMSRLLREDKENMDALMASFKQYAGQVQTATSANNGNNDALTAALQKISELEKAYSDLQKAMKENTETQKKVNDEKRKYKKLTDDEIKSVEELRAALAGTAEEQMSAVKSINVQSKSYNELNAVYNALKDSLNKLTVAERQNTEAGKAMTDQAKNIRDTMNQLQQATGNYTLNVGNYMSAMNGLKFQTQQLFREIPSAQNVQQFFLAISNNIPMFTDALVRYNKGIPEIKTKLAAVTAEIAKQEAELANMNALSSEYAAKQVQINELKKQEVQLQGMTKNGWAAVLKSVFSWQTLLIAGLLLLRKMPDIIKSIKEWWDRWKNGVKEVKNEITAVAAIAKMQSEVIKKTQDEIAELQLVAEKLKDVERGTDEWIAGVKTVNEITKQNLDTTKATPEEIEKVTEAYKEQARQLAKNAILTDMIAKSDANQLLREVAYDAQTYGTARQALGLDLDSKEEKEFRRIVGERNRAIKAYRLKERKEIWVGGSVENGGHYEIEDEREASVRRKKEMDNALQDYRNFINKRLEVLSPEAVRKLEEQYELIDPLNKEKNGRNKTYSLKDVDFLESELLDKDAVVELESGFKRRLAMLVEQEEKERLVLKEKYDRESKDLEYNKEHNLITEKEYQEQRKKLDDNYNDLIKTNYEGNFEEMGVIQRKYWNKRNEVTAKEADREEKEALKREKKAIKDMENEYASQYRIVQRRIKTIQQEKQQNQDLAFNISLAKEELKKLNEMVITAGEDATGYTERINKLTQQIEKWRKQMQFDKQLSNYGSVWDIFQRNGAFDASNGIMRGIAKNLLGDLADSLDDEQIEQIYDTWLQNTQKAASEWYNTTMGYINDLISAYVELANAKAEAAAEATEAAQEEYDKEKALLEAGYASRVEATWAEYQEKKAAQEKAEEDAKKAAKAQQEINNISTMGSLITAAANIWKTFTEIPVVGIPLAIAATGTMFGAFLAAKIKANEVSKYGEGGFEVLEGGSHASGHDIDLGVRNRKGRRMRAEGKEGLGIFSRKAMAHYGANNIEAMVNSVNRLEFEGNAAKRMSLERSVGMAVLSAPRTDLHRVESDLHKLVSYGSRSRTVNADGSVTEYRKNGKVTIKKG